MNPTVYFLDQTKLVNFTEIDPNLNLSIVLPSLLRAQDMYLQNVIGSQFYTTFQTQIYNYQQTGSSASFSAYYQTLLDTKIAPYLEAVTVMMALPHIGYRIRNNGVTKMGSTPGADEASKDEIGGLRDTYMNYVEFYEQRLMKELKLWSWKYPDYVSFAVQQDMYPSKKNAYNSGIVIPRKGSKIMNQQFGRPLYAQGNSFSSYNGQDIAAEFFSPVPFNTNP